MLIENGYIYINKCGDFFIFENKTKKISDKFALEFLYNNKTKFIKTNKMFF